MSQFIESISCQNGRFPLLPYHHKRMERTFRSLGITTTPILLDQLVSEIEKPQKGHFKFRLIYDQNGIRSYSFSPYAIPSIKSLKIVHNDEIEYSLKTTDRSFLNRLYEKKGNADDIIIIKNKQATDSWFCNLVFKAGDQLYTPKYPLLEGCRRAYYLDEDIISPLEIHWNEIKSFDGVYLINAMLSLEQAPYVPVDQIFGL